MNWALILAIAALLVGSVALVLAAVANIRLDALGRWLVTLKETAKKYGITLACVILALVSPK